MRVIHPARRITCRYSVDFIAYSCCVTSVSYTQLDVYKRQHIHSRLPLCRIAEMVVMTMDMVAVIHLRKCRDFSGKCKIPARKIVYGCLFSGFPARIPEGIVRLSAAARPFPGPAAACGLFRPVRPPFSFLRRSDRDVPGDFPCRAFGNKERCV